MVKDYVIDASAIFRYTDGERGGERVEELLKQALSGDVQLLLSVVNWGEIVGILSKRHGLAAAQGMSEKLMALPINLVVADRSDAEGAAYLKHDYGVPYADAFAASLAHRLSATLVTADFDFKKLPRSTIAIEFLPTK